VGREVFSFNHVARAVSLASSKSVGAASFDLARRFSGVNAANARRMLSLCNPVRLLSALPSLPSVWLSLHQVARVAGMLGRKRT